jgi:nucleoid-associated protein YgaU
MVKLIRALAALLVLLALVGGVPLFLVTVAGNPYPPGGLAELGMLSDAAVLGLGAAIGWLFWAQMTACVLWEIPAALRGVPAARFPVATGGQQRLVRILMHSVVAVGVTSAVLAPGSMQHAEASRGHAPVRTAPVQTVQDGTPEQSPASATQLAQATTATATPTTAATAAPTVTAATGDTLWGLAEQHLGAGERWREIADLNRGRDMGNATFTTAETLRAGWVLELPADATNLAAPAAGPESVVVEPGDNLWDISQKQLGDGNLWPSLYEKNQTVVGSDPNLIFPGQVIKIPGAAGESVVEQPTPEVSEPEVIEPEVIERGVIERGVIERGVRKPQVREPEVVDQPAEQELEAGSPVAPQVETSPEATVTEPAAPEAEPTTATAAESEEDQGGITALRALLASALCLSGGAVAMLLAGRRRQFRERRSGRSIAATPSELVGVERAVLEAGSESMETTEFIDLALRHLAASQRVAGRELPNVGAAVIGEEEFAVLFTDPVDGEVPHGWDATNDGRAWTLPRETILEDELREQPAPYPALVSVGVDPSGRTWMLDLEAAGVFGVAGTGAQVEDLVRFLVAELALNAWSDGTEVMLTADFATETVGLNPTRVQLVDAETAARRGARTARDTIESAENMGMDLLDFRRDAIAIDSTGAVVIIVPGQAEDELVDAVRGRARSRVVVVHDDEMPAIELTGDGMAYLPMWAVTLEPHTLPAEQAAAMADLMGAVRQVEDQPMPAADESTPLGRLMTADGALREEFTEPRVAEGDDPNSLLPDADEVYVAAAATTAEDLAALAPSVPAELRAEIEALDPGLDDDMAAWNDPELRRPRVRVMGPIEVQAWGERKEEVDNVGGTTEFIVYLACQEHGVSPERSAAALRWTARTVWNRATDARKLLGERADGDPWVWDAPISPTARKTGVAAYELHPEVLVDADLFRRLHLRAPARGAEGLEDLVAALSLVTGLPFDRQRKRGYGWLVDGQRHDHYLAHAVSDVAHLVVNRALASSDTATARWACEIAIKADPDADRPRLDLAAVTAAEGSGSADDVVAEQVIDRVDADPTARTEQVLDQRGWLVS